MITLSIAQHPGSKQVAHSKALTEEFAEGQSWRTNKELAKSPGTSNSGEGLPFQACTGAPDTHGGHRGMRPLSEPQMKWGN